MKKLTLDKTELAVLGRRIREARKRGKYTQAEVCELLDCSEGHLSAVENGHVMAGGSELVAFCRLFEVDFNYLFDNIVDRHPIGDDAKNIEQRFLSDASDETLVVMKQVTKHLMEQLEIQLQTRESK